MAETVYLLCAVTSITCAVMLLRAYLRSRTGLLAWATWAFVGFAVNNVLLFVDLTMMVSADLSTWRTVTALAAITVLLVGLIQESR